MFLATNFGGINDRNADAQRTTVKRPRRLMGTIAFVIFMPLASSCKDADVQVDTSSGRHASDLGSITFLSAVRNHAVDLAVWR